MMMSSAMPVLYGMMSAVLSAVDLIMSSTDSVVE